MLSCDTDPATGVIEITVDGAITRAVAALTPAEIRVFPLAALDEARAWGRQGLIQHMDGAWQAGIGRSAHAHRPALSQREQN